MSIRKSVTFALFALSLPALADVAAPSRLPETLRLEAVKLAETPIQIAQARGVSAAPGEKPGTAVVSFTVTYSNSCVAGANGRIEPLTARAGNKLSVVLRRGPSLRIACPAVYMPVTVNYEVEVARLVAGETYSIEVLGARETAEVTVPR